MPDFNAAIERIVAGLGEEEPGPQRPGRRTVVAYHEMGHALVAAACPAPTRCTRSPSSPRGRALGYPSSGPPRTAS